MLQTERCEPKFSCRVEPCKSEHIQTYYVQQTVLRLSYTFYTMGRTPLGASLMLFHAVALFEELVDVVVVSSLLNVSGYESY